MRPQNQTSSTAYDVVASFGADLGMRRANKVRPPRKVAGQVVVGFGPRRAKAVRPPHNAHGQEAGSTPHTAKSTPMARYYEQASGASHNNKYR